MCKCTPNIRTPFCGRGDCLPPTECICGVGNFGVAYHRRPCPWVDVVGSEMPKHEQDRLAEADAQRALDRVWAQAIRQSQIATSEQPTKLTAQEAQQLFVELAALRTQLEQAQPRECGLCGLETMVLNPHPDAGIPSRLLEVGAVWECVPCSRLSAHQWASRAWQAEARETALREALAELIDAHDHWFDTGMGEGQSMAATAKSKGDTG